MQFGILDPELGNVGKVFISIHFRNGPRNERGVGVHRATRGKPEGRVQGCRPTPGQLRLWEGSGRLGIKLGHAPESMAHWACFQIQKEMDNSFKSTVRLK